MEASMVAEKKIEIIARCSYVCKAKGAGKREIIFVRDVSAEMVTYFDPRSATKQKTMPLQEFEKMTIRRA